MKAEAAVFVIRLKIIIFCDANQRKSDFLWTFLFCGILFRLTGGVSGGTEKAGE